MADDIESLANTTEQMRLAQAKIADIMAFATQRLERYQQIRDRLEEQRQNGEKPSELRQTWADLRDEGDAAKQDMAQFVQQFEQDHARFGKGKAKNKP